MTLYLQVATNKQNMIPEFLIDPRPTSGMKQENPVAKLTIDLNWNQQKNVASPMSTCKWASK